MDFSTSDDRAASRWVGLWLGERPPFVPEGEVRSLAGRGRKGGRGRGRGLPSFSDDCGLVPSDKEARSETIHGERDQINFIQRSKLNRFYICMPCSASAVPSLSISQWEQSNDLNDSA